MNFPDCLIPAVSLANYRMLYHMDSGRNIGFFDHDLRVNFVPGFFTDMDRERCANVMLFLPFGVLYPLYKQDASWKRTVWSGSVFSIIIETMQPFFGRAFDINDIILNIIGVLISATGFYTIKRVLKTNDSNTLTISNMTDRGFFLTRFSFHLSNIKS